MCRDRLARGVLKALNVFISGCYGIKKINIVRHVASCHKDDSDEPTTDPATTDIKTALQMAELLEKERVLTIFADCYALAKEDASLNSIIRRCNFTSFQTQKIFRHSIPL